MGLIQSKAKALGIPYPPEPLTSSDPYGFDDAPTPLTPSARSKTPGHPFSADLDLAELDDRQRPGAAWAARSQILSRSHLVILSRRMSYLNRVLVVAVHLVDDNPVPLLGKVTECDYHADGLYRITLNLLPITQFEFINAWINNLGGRRA